MTGHSPVHHRTVVKRRFHSIHIHGNLRLCTDKVHFTEKVISLQKFRNLRPQLGRERRKYGYHFAFFLGFKLAYTVICLYHLGRFYKHCLSTRRFIVYYTTHLALERRRYRDDQTAVAHGRRRILLDKSFGLCTAKNTVERA